MRATIEFFVHGKTAQEVKQNVQERWIAIMGKDAGEIPESAEVKIRENDANEPLIGYVTVRTKVGN